MYKVLMFALVIAMLSVGLLVYTTQAKSSVAGPSADCGTAVVPGTLNGPALQENGLLCDGTICSAQVVFTSQDVVCEAALGAAANARVLVGTPLHEYTTVDWGGLTVTYVEFSSGYHAEYHTIDKTVRFYNLFNQRVY